MPRWPPRASGTSFSLQGLWAAPSLTDVAGLERSAIVEHLILMAAVLSASALLLGALAERLRRAGIPTEMFLAGTLALSMAAQLALLLGVPVSSHLLFAIIAAAGAAPVLSFAILARYFPKEVAGRANAALGVLNMGTAFGLQSLAGLIIAQWPADGGHCPAVAHQAAMAAGLGLQLISLGVFFAPKGTSQPIPMARAVARALGIDPSTVETMPSSYRAAVSAWRRHVVDTRRQATAWRFAALASMALCVSLAGALSLALTHPVTALHVAESGSMTRVSAHATSVPFEGATVTAAPTLPSGFGKVQQLMTENDADGLCQRSSPQESSGRAEKRSPIATAANEACAGHEVPSGSSSSERAATKPPVGRLRKRLRPAKRAA